ncbi:MAG: hypothetical protein LUE86_13230 [Clostridiales bacterium]|nr:hypothetical protein [Clostridiales bacterium]
MLAQLMRKDFNGTFETEFNGLEATEENMEEYAEDVALDLENGTAYITWSQNYDWKVLEVQE